MLYEGTIYEAGGFAMKEYSKQFIDAFMTKPSDDYPLTDGMTDQDYSGTGERIKKYGLKFARTPLLVAYELEPGSWSLNLASDPDVVVAQIDHNAKLYRTPDVSDNNKALTAQTYTTAIFNKLYKHSYNKKRSTVTRPMDSDYGRTAEIVTKDWTNSKFLSKLDISHLWKSL